MSEEILKALTQLFAIITKQDGGVTENEREYVRVFFAQQLNPDLVLEYMEMYDDKSGYIPENQQVEEKESEEEGDEKKEKSDRMKKREGLTEMKDMVRTLAICRKINKTLAQKQKVIVLIRLLELLASDRNFTKQRMAIIETVSDTFNIKNEEYKVIESFVIQQEMKDLDYEDILIVDEEKHELAAAKQIISDRFDGEVVFLRVSSEELYFVRYQNVHEKEVTSTHKIVLNGMDIPPNQVQVFSNGSIIKAGRGGDPLYYSDVIFNFNKGLKQANISFNVYDLGFKFPNGHIGLRNVNLSETAGSLVAIMGASGAGKTTLLNVLAGIESPSSGKVLVNGTELHPNKDKIQGMIGYIAQDDILIEDLTVFENLFYNAKLCFKDLNKEELEEKVMETLKSLGLDHIRDLKVGSVLNKKISGGQRKRLNIALELIREPQVLFVDEPTSGLSSRDSENVIDLLKELTLKGKLIFCVIHQPSSDIYKMFDKLYLMDTGGYPIFYGNPVEAVTYFKTLNNQVDKEIGQCPECGNVNPEQIFNIVESRMVDEYGQFSRERKVNPPQWHSFYKKNYSVEHAADIEEEIPAGLNIPNRIKQYIVFMTRDLKSKFSNNQYMIINLLEAPVLALVMAFIIRYQNDPDTGQYMYRFNDNIPAFILISVVIALFMGMTVSAEEIIKDRKIQKREAFLKLSRTSYLLSKVSILFLLSAIQTFTYVIVGVLILEIKGMTAEYWLVLFTVSCFANMLGLNISASFNSAVTIYILIPLLVIPQMILSGGIFSFDKMNEFLGKSAAPPFIADIMASRWGFEALTVKQYKDNKYQQLIFPIEMLESQSDYNSTFLLSELTSDMNDVNEVLGKDEVSVEDKVFVRDRIAILHRELETIYRELPNMVVLFRGNKAAISMLKDGSAVLKDLKAYLEGSRIKAGGPTQDRVEEVKSLLGKLQNYYSKMFIFFNNLKDDRLASYDPAAHNGRQLNELKNLYYNDQLNDFVRNAAAKEKIEEINGRYVQRIDPIYNLPDKRESVLDYKIHFYAPQKLFFGTVMPTFWYNIMVIWFMSVVLYFTLYNESLLRFINWSSRLNIGGRVSERLKKLNSKKKSKEGSTSKDTEKKASSKATKASSRKKIDKKKPVEEQ